MDFRERKCCYHCNKAVLKSCHHQAQCINIILCRCTRTDSPRMWGHLVKGTLVWAAKWAKTSKSDRMSQNRDLMSRIRDLRSRNIYHRSRTQTVVSNLDLMTRNLYRTCRSRSKSSLISTSTVCVQDLRYIFPELRSDFET